MLKKKEDVKAFQKYHRALLINPNHHQTHFSWALTLFHQGEFQEAHNKLSHLFQTSLTDANDIYLMANICLKLNLYTKADDSFEQLRRKNPRRPGLYIGWACARYFMGDFSGAKEHLLKSLTLDSRNSEAHRIMGVLLFTEEKYQEAVAYFKIAIDLEPLEILNWLSWSLAFFLQKKGKEALEKFNKGLEIIKDGEPILRKEVLGILKKDLEFQKKYLESGGDEQKKIAFKDSIVAFKKVISLLEQPENLEPFKLLRHPTHEKESSTCLDRFKEIIKSFL